MRGFGTECRHVLVTPGMAIVPLYIAVTAGIDTHEGVPLDILNAVVSTAFATTVLVLLLASIRKIRWFRQRMDSGSRSYQRTRTAHTTSHPTKNAD